MPLALYFKDGRAKAEIALARGKKEYDKRQTLREKQDRRESARDRGGEAEAAGRVATGNTVASTCVVHVRWDCTSQRVRNPLRRGLKKQHGDDRFRQRLSKQGKRVEEATMISLTICRNQ